MSVFCSLSRCFQLLHCSDLDELLQQRGAFHQVSAQAQVGHHPVLHLVEAPHEALQVGRDGAGEFVTAEHVVDELHLRDKDDQSRLRLSGASDCGNLVHGGEELPVVGGELGGHVFGAHLLKDVGRSSFWTLLLLQGELGRRACR